MSKSDAQKEETFDWIELHKQIGSDQETGQQQRDQVSTRDKFVRKFKENPFVPIGAAATTLCLAVGLVSFMRKRSDLSQTMMRGRILAQGFTVAGLIGGLFYSAKGQAEGRMK